MSRRARPLAIAMELDSAPTDAELVAAPNYDAAAAHLAVIDAEAALIKWLDVLLEVRPEALPRSVRDLLGHVHTARKAVTL